MRKRRRLLRIMGYLFIVVAVVLIGSGAWGIFSNGMLTSQSLEEAEMLVQEMSEVQGLNSGNENVTDPSDPISADPSVIDPAVTIGADFTGVATNDPTGSPGVKRTPGTSGTTAPSAIVTTPPKKTGPLGYLVFESLGGRKVPVVEGATAKSLKKGAGHHPQTSNPGGTGNCLIFGHRDTVFRSFGSLAVGNRIRFVTPGGEYTYQILTMQVVEPKDPLMFQTYNKAVLTLVTCYPFRYIGSAPQRYVVIAELVS